MNGPGWWRKVARKNTKEKGRGEGEVDEDVEERRIRGQIVQEVAAQAPRIR